MAHWSEQLAKEVLEKYPDRAEYVVASGISPSGSVHIGNYREFVTNYFVAWQLRKMGKAVRMIFSWDEFDRFRKVPKNFLNLPTAEKLDYSNFIGRPYVDIPSPFGGNESSAKYFEREFEEAIKILHPEIYGDFSMPAQPDVPKISQPNSCAAQFTIQFCYQAKEYRGARYGEQIALAMKKRKKIYDIISSFKTQGEDEGERDSYYPISIYCDYCGKDNTYILGYNEKTGEIEYECKCGRIHKTNVKTADNIKLVWKVDWPMRWKAENVCFEAAGIDHHSEGGSFDVASKIAREIFGIEPPVSVCYAWVGVRGLNGVNGRVDMHSSSGLNITPNKLLQIYEPEILRWLYAKYPVGSAFDFGFDDTIIRYYQEFDRGLNDYLLGKCEEYERPFYDLALFDDIKSGGRVNFGTLAAVAPLAGFDRALTRKMLEKAGLSSFGHFDERFSRVRFWLENYMPEKIYKLLFARNNEFYNTLTDEQKGVLAKLKKYLEKDRSEQEIQEFLYSIINDKKLDKKQNQIRQQEYFKIFYSMLFGRPDGPRLYLFLATAPREKYINLL
jgi:lysyl-tRNA synthetase class 1